jgi:hypothetical protein
MTPNIPNRKFSIGKLLNDAVKVLVGVATAGFLISNLSWKEKAIHFENDTIKIVIQWKGELPGEN